MIALLWPLLPNLAIGLILVYSYLFCYSAQGNKWNSSFEFLNHEFFSILFSNSLVFIFNNVKRFYLFISSDAHYGIDQQHCQSSWGVYVFGGVGERTHEGNDLYMKMKKDYFHQR